jgi:cell filamentation protein
MGEFSRYRVAQGIEGEYEPGSHGKVLRNLLGVVRPRDMDRAEHEALIAIQRRDLALITPRSRITPARLCRMHREWLGGIYPWAGRYRTVELAKARFRWPPARLVAANMREFSQAVLRPLTPCKPGPLAEVAARLARVHAELLLIHPFREGNGRLARWVANLMALQAGVAAPEYGFFGRGARQRRIAYLHAVQYGYLGDYEPLARFFRAALERRTRNLP